MLLLKKHTGNTPTKISAVLGTSQKQFRQFTVVGDPDSAGDAFLGPSTVVAAGTNHTFRIKPAGSFNLGPAGTDRPFVFDTDTNYVVAQAAENVYFVVVTEDGR